MVVSIAATAVLQFGGAAGRLSEGLTGKVHATSDSTSSSDEKKSSSKSSPASGDKKSDTKDPTKVLDKLTKQHEGLVEKMSKLEPMLNKAENFMNQLDKLSSLSSGK